VATRREHQPDQLVPHRAWTPKFRVGVRDLGMASGEAQMGKWRRFRGFQARGLGDPAKL
jgi:hypothetical protein